jgi:signal transduction histidine kinase
VILPKRWETRRPEWFRGGLAGRADLLLVGAIAGAVGAVSLHTSAASDLSYLTESALTAGLGLAAGWGLVMVGLETIRRRRRQRFGYLLVAAGLAWFLPEWSDPSVGQPVAFTVGLLFAWLYPAVIGEALFVIASSRIPARLRRMPALGYGIFVIGLGIIPTMGFDPRAAGCSCPANLLGVGGASGFTDAAATFAALLAASWALATAIVIGYALARSAPASRRILGPILAPGILFFVVVVVALARTIVEVVPPTDATQRLLRLAQAVSMILVAFGVAAEWLRARRARTDLARVVADLAGSPPIGGLRDHLASITGDAELRLVYPIRGGDVFVDSQGRPIELQPVPLRTATPIVREGQVVAVVEHASQVLQDPAEVDEVVAAARLGLEHERLQANARAELAALRAARRRIVDAGDAHRRQLERDLHDGAQQQLIALSIGLRFVERASDTNAWLDEAAAELRRALEDLREVAHGIYPAVLGDEGFAAAVDALAEGSPVPISIPEMVQERFDATAEVAAYHVVADVVRAGSGPFRVRARRTHERFTVEIAASEIPADVSDEIADRVGAVDGSLERHRDGAWSTLVAEIPMLVPA